MLDIKLKDKYLACVCIQETVFEVPHNLCVCLHESSEMKAGFNFQ